MNIAVCIKAVPSTTEVRMDPETNTIVRDGRQSVVNPFDAAALEVAVRIKEQLGGQVCALSMGIPDTVRLLRDCLARGADRGLLLSDRAFAGADTLATSYALSRAVEQIGGMARPAVEGAGSEGEGDGDNTAGGAGTAGAGVGGEETEDAGVSLIVCGKMAVDGDTAQIGPELAAVLGIPCVTNVEEIVEARADSLLLRRSADGIQEVVQVELPAVITVAKDICVPRMPSITGVRFGETGPVEVKTAAEVGADPARSGLAGSPTQVVRSFTPERGAGGAVVSGTPREQAAALADIVRGGAR